MSNQVKYITKVTENKTGEVFWLGYYFGCSKLVLRSFRDKAAPICWQKAKDAERIYTAVGCNVEIIEMGIRGAVK